MTSVLIVDDHPMMRSALALAVRRAQPHAPVLEAGSLAEAIDILDVEQVALVLLDLRIPGGDRFAALREIAARPNAPVIVVVSAHEGEAVVNAALRNGASAFLKKSLPFDEIAEAINHALKAHSSAIHVAPQSCTQPTEQVLTPAQVLVLECLREGKSNKQIAFELGVVEATVKAHLTAIFRKFQVSNRTQAVLAAFDDEENLY